MASSRTSSFALVSFWRMACRRGLPEPSTGINGDPSPATAEMGKIFLDFKIADASEQIRKAIAQ